MPKKSSANVDPDLKPSRSAKKRDAAAIQKLGEALADLSPAERKKLDLDEDLLEALALLDRTTDREGARRQRQYVGKLMRRMDTEKIEEFLAAKADARELETSRFEKTKNLRDKLIKAGPEEIERLTRETAQIFANTENPEEYLAKFKELLAVARGDASPRAVGASRELFRLLHDAAD